MDELEKDFNSINIFKYVVLEISLCLIYVMILIQYIVCIVAVAKAAIAIYLIAML